MLNRIKFSVDKNIKKLDFPKIELEFVRSVEVNKHNDYETRM